MNSTYRTTAVFRATIACVASLVGASAAHAVDWTGYMRGGPAATSVSGLGADCIANPAGASQAYGERPAAATRSSRRHRQ